MGDGFPCTKTKNKYNTNTVVSNDEDIFIAQFLLLHTIIHQHIQLIYPNLFKKLKQCRAIFYLFQKCLSARGFECNPTAMRPDEWIFANLL